VSVKPEANQPTASLAGSLCQLIHVRQYPAMPIFLRKIATLRQGTARSAAP